MRVALAVLRGVAGVAMALLSVFCIFVIIFSASREGSHSANRSPVPDFVDAAVVVYALFASGTAWAAWKLLRNRKPRNSPGSPEIDRAEEEWETADGQAFRRPRFGVFVLVLTTPIVIPFLALVFLLVPQLVGAGLRTLSQGSIIRGLEQVLFGGALAAVSAAYVYVCWTNVRLWGSPAAIVGKDGITLPRRTPPFVLWADVASIQAFSMSKNAFLELILTEPANVYPKRRGWWHGPWRDSVTIGIGSTSHPLVSAAQKAHAEWWDGAGNSRLTQPVR